jgi:hypothetical protein
MRIEMNLSAAKENKAKAPASSNTFFILCCVYVVRSCFRIVLL